MHSNQKRGSADVCAIGFYTAKRRAGTSGNSIGVSAIISYHTRTDHLIAYEIKAGKDTLKPAQKIFLADVANSGGVSIVVISTKDREEFLKR